MSCRRRVLVSGRGLLGLFPGCNWFCWASRLFCHLSLSVMARLSPAASTCWRRCAAGRELFQFQHLDPAGEALLLEAGWPVAGPPCSLSDSAAGSSGDRAGSGSATIRLRSLVDPQVILPGPCSPAGWRLSVTPRRLLRRLIWRLLLRLMAWRTGRPSLEGRRGRTGLGLDRPAGPP